MDPKVQQEIYELHAGLCKALADPKRLLLIESLRAGALTVGAMAEELGISQSNVSQHLGILRDRGVVIAERQGNNVFYSLSDPRVLDAIDVLRKVMADQLARRGRLHRAVAS